MKVTIMLIAGVMMFAGATVYAAKLVKGVEFATVGIGSDAVTVYKVQDGDATCYISRHGKFGAHGISCVK